MATANRVVGLVTGSLFVLLGLVGLVVSWGGGFVGLGVSLAGVIAINPALSVILIALGGTVLAAALVSLRVSRVANAWVGFGFLVLGFVGLFLVGPEPNVLVLTSTANAIHFAAAALLLAVGLGANRPS
ncbi:DUF4383 domain-containing protein [Schumannella luteola]